MKPSESKYAELVNKVRAIYEKHGSELYYSADDWSLNQYQATKTNLVFVFYYDSLNQIKTPLGGITPLGSYSAGNTKAAMEEIIKEFGLIHTKTTNENHEQWNYYEAPDI